MKRDRTLSKTTAVLGAAAASAALACGCAADARDATSAEQTGATDQAWTETKSDAIDATRFQGLVELANLAGCSFTVTDGHGVFTPSASIAAAMFPNEHPAAPERHTVSIDVPTVDYDPGTFLPTLHATLASLQSTDVEADLQTNDAHAHVELRGSIHVHTASPWPDGDVVLDKVTIDATVKTVNGQLVADDVRSDIQHHVENCGLFGWCDGLVNDAIPDLSGKLDALVKGALAAELAKPEAQSGFVSLLTQIENFGVTGPRWRVLGGSVEIARTAINMELWREWPPAQPSGCYSSVLCDGTVDFRCANEPERLLLQRDLGGGQWKIVGSDDDVSRRVLPMLDDEHPGFGGVASYRVCATNGAGTLCTAPFAVTLATGDTCSHGGGGGGGVPTGCHKDAYGKLHCISLQE